MRYLYIFFFLCLMAGKVFSQTEPAKKDSSAPPRIVFRCQATIQYRQPLWVVDGVVADTAYIRKIDPNDIEYIEILKDASATALYGYRASSGVIILTTKTARMRQFLVKDFLEGTGLSGATLTFISLKNEKDSLRFVADEQGMVKTTVLEPGEEYKIMISSVGYKTSFATYKNASSGGPNQFLLERDVKENLPVVVISGVTIRCRFITGRYCSTISCTSFTSDLTSAGSLLSTRIYPNPLKSGGVIKAEVNMQEEKPLQLRITNLNGSVLRLVIYRPFKGINRIELPTESQWAAGIYFVQVLDEKGKLLKQDKLLIQ